MCVCMYMHVHTHKRARRSREVGHSRAKSMSSHRAVDPEVECCYHHLISVCCLTPFCSSISRVLGIELAVTALATDAFTC